MATIARLTLWHTADAETDLRAAHADLLTPLLATHGATDPLPCPRPAAPGVFSVLYALPDARAVRTAAKALARDPEWQRALAQLGAEYGPDASSSSALTPLTAPASSTGSGALLPPLAGVAAAPTALAPGALSRSPSPGDLSRPGPAVGTAPRASLRWSFALYSTPAIPSRTLQAGPGLRSAAWHAYGLPDGMASAAMQTILQDSSGRLWLTHAEGVSCFDGSTFAHYTAADGLPHHFMAAQTEDTHGHLWFASNGEYPFARRGICRFDGASFEHYTVADGLLSDAVRCMLTTAEGEVWVFTDLGPVVYREDRFVPPAHVQGTPPPAVLAARQDVDGRLWLSGRNGLCTYWRGVYQWFDLTPPPRRPLVWSTLEDREGVIWAGSPYGVYRSQPDGSFAQVPLGIDASVGADPIVLDADGTVWFAAFTGGLLCHAVGGTNTGFTRTEGLPSTRPTAGLLDRDRQVWIAFDGGGIARYEGARTHQHTVQTGLLHNGCTFIKQDRGGRMWVGTAKGTCRFADEAWEPVDPAPNWATALIDLLIDPDGGLWGVEHHSAVRRYQNGTWQPSLPPEPGSFNNGALVRAWDGSVWCANGSAGVHQYRDGTWTTFAAEHDVPAGQVRALAADSLRKRVWVGTTDGVVAFLDRGCFHILSEGDEWDQRCILHLYIDRQARLWIGTEGAGVAWWDGQQLSRLTQDDGLGAEQVLRIGEDRLGRLVFCTQGGGVSFYDGEVIQTLTQRDGLASDVVADFVHDAHGTYWFATQDGLSCYRSVGRSPVVRITEVVADRTYWPGPRTPGAAPAAVLQPPNLSPCTGALPADAPLAEPPLSHELLPEPLQLPVSQRIVRVAFQARSLSARADAMVYRYRLAGRDSEWRVTRDCGVTLEDLSLGTYTLQVQAVDPGLNYSAPAELTVEVIPDPRIAAVAEAFRQNAPVGEWVGISPAAQQVYQQLRRVADTALTVLLTGATGTGKGLAARCLHRLSSRRDGPFVHVNCGAIPVELIESELFGHERGAFTGAHARKLGKVELAAGGTLFLDEIGEMGPDAQVRLLRLLEERTFDRLGGTKALNSDVRVIAATNRDLGTLSRQGSFRTDLLYRLNVYPVEMPPLRDRSADIGVLANHFLATERSLGPDRARPRGLTRTALAALQRYEWPGNIRELRNIIERAIILCPGRTIGVADLALPSTASAGEPDAAAPCASVSTPAADLAAAVASAVDSAAATVPGSQTNAAPAPIVGGTPTDPSTPDREPPAGHTGTSSDTGAQTVPARPTAGAAPTRRPTLVEVERAYLMQVLEEANWAIRGNRGAAAALGMAESSLRARMRILGIRRPA